MPEVLANVTPALEQPESLDPVAQQRMEQAQRDVAQYMKQREAAGTTPAWSDDAGRSEMVSGEATPAPPAPPAGPTRRVIFNDGPSNSRSGNATAETTPVQEGDNLEPSSLFRDPAVPPEIESFDPAATPDAGLDLAPDRLRQLMVDLRRELYIEGAHSDQPIKQLLPIAALAMIDPEAALDPEAVPDLTDTERELLAALQAFFKSLATRLDEGDDVEEAIASGVLELREAVIKEPTLKLPDLALCYRVEGYGSYDAFGHYRFLAHDEQQLIVYVEIDDFTSETNTKGEWVTELSQQITIYSDRDGIPVWRSGDMQTAIDKAQKQRHDFFLLQIITLPRALSVGKYHLKVHIRDEKSGAEAENAVEFEMVADPKLAVTIPGTK